MPGEYNFWCDPDAAQTVLASGASIRLVGLDVTNQVRLTHADTAAMAATGRAGKAFAPFAADAPTAGSRISSGSRSATSASTTAARCTTRSPSPS